MFVPVVSDLEIVNKEAVKQFSKKHSHSRSPLSRWIQATEAAVWQNILDVQRNFKTAEDVKGYVVFNIHGNDFRLIAVIRYTSKQVIIHEVMTHSEYDKWKP